MENSKFVEKGKLGKGVYAMAANDIVWAVQNPDSILLTQMNHETGNFQTFEVIFSSPHTEITKIWSLINSKNDLICFISLSDYSFLLTVNSQLR